MAKKVKDAQAEDDVKVGPGEILSGDVIVKKVEGGELVLALEGVPGVVRVPLANLPDGFNPETQTAQGVFSIAISIFPKG